MKNGALRKVRRLVVYSALVAGLGYSMQALGAKPVYANSCDCAEEQLDAQSFCYTHFGNRELAWFQCPIDFGGGSFGYAFGCSWDPQHLPYTPVCD